MVEVDLSTYDLDVLKEIGNIASGNAATALSQILGRRVNLDVPEVELCHLTQIAEKLGGAETVRTGIFLEVKEALKGHIFFILRDGDAHKLHKIASMGMDIDMQSVMSEVSNIITGSYVGAIATMIDELIDITTPCIGHDMIGALTDSIVSSMLDVADRTVFIKTTLTVDDQTIEANYVLMLEQDSLTKLLDFFRGKQ